MSHTKGPWKWTQYPYYSEWNGFQRIQEVLSGEDDKLIVEKTYRLGRPPNPADMALIAAAPDLLAACKDLVEHIESGRERILVSVLSAAHAAIARAEGAE